MKAIVALEHSILTAACATTHRRPSLWRERLFLIGAGITVLAVALYETSLKT